MSRGITSVILRVPQQLLAVKRHKQTRNRFKVNFENIVVFLMWQPKQVERALFRWGKWRSSLINQWMKSESELRELSLDELRLVVKHELQRLALEGPVMALYWICSVVSDCNLDYETSFEKIIITSWLASLIRDLRLGARVYPPWLITERDKHFFGSSGMVLPLDHELYSIIDALRGRPRKHGTPGRLPKYPDRLAVKCAVFKDVSKITYVKIAKPLGLPTKRNKETGQDESSTVRHLVNRGRKLIS